MVNIPLIQGNSIQDINTSIIAIKKAQKELETLNTQIDNKIKALNLALSGGPGKYIESIQEVQGLIKVTEGSITDTIASGNTQPATSNGVADAISTEATARDTAIANANYLVSIGNSDYPDNFPSDAMRIYRVHNYNIGWVSSDGFIINIPWSAQFGFQIALDDQSNWIAVRSKANNVWNAWERVYSGRKLDAITGFSYSMASGYSAIQIMIDNVNFLASGINVFHLSIINVSGGTIGTTAGNVIGSCNLRPIQNTIAIGMDYVSGRPVRVEILPSGSIIILESVGVTQGSNQIRAVFTALL